MPGVLVVDDEPDMRILVQRIIERANEGLTVVGEAASGLEAIAAWRAVSPDMILLDQQMPEMTGLEAAERILAEQPDQRIVLFTAFLDAPLRARATELGIRACLAKTEAFRIPEILQTLRGE